MAIPAPATALLSAIPIDSALKDDPYHRAAAFMLPQAAFFGRYTVERGNDGRFYHHYRLDSGMNGQPEPFTTSLTRRAALPTSNSNGGGDRNAPGLQSGIRDIESAPFRERYRVGERHGLISTHQPRPLTHLFPTEELPLEWSMAHEKWRLISAIWAIENCGDDCQSLFDEINTIWVYFNEPEDMKSLVSFIPTDDPLASEESLRRKIYDFVDRKKAEVNGLRPDRTR
jgi:Uncharacterized protein conserved in bacteria (DUF2247)